MTQPLKSLLPGTDSVNYKNLYTDIVLTEEEIDYALYEIRKKKYGIQKENEYWEKVRQQSEPLKLNNQQFEKYILGKAKNNGIDFIKDEFNSQIFDLLTLYFNNDAKFEEAGYSLKKGILLYGGVGCGKTTILKMFAQNPKHSYIMASCNTIASNFSKGGYDEIQRFFTPVRSDLDTFAHNTRGICFDDLGTEKNKKYFGNDSNVMEEIISNWYNLLSNYPERLHISTNLSVSEIETVYGTRVRSRMREMFNLFEFDKNAPDRRK